MRKLFTISSAASVLGAAGGRARWSKLSQQERSELARHIVAQRWAKRTGAVENTNTQQVPLSNAAGER